MLIRYLIIIAVLVLIAIIVIKINKKDFSIEINKLIQYLGGKGNIKGIVEVDDQLKIIFGPNSKALKKYMVDLKK